LFFADFVAIPEVFTSFVDRKEKSPSDVKTMKQEEGKWMAEFAERNVAFHPHKLAYKHRVLRRRIRPALASVLDEWTWKRLKARKGRVPCLPRPE
jgi:hypothetical protein